MARTAVRATVAGAVLALVSLGTLRMVGRVVDPAPFSGAAIQLIAALAAGAAAYLGTCVLLGVREIGLVRSFARRNRAPAGSAEDAEA